MRYQGTFQMELLRKIVHILVGVFIVLLFQSAIIDLWTFGLIVLAYAAILLLNMKYEHELLTKVLSINRADRDIPGLDILFYFAGCWVVLAVAMTGLYPVRVAFAAILVLAFADSVAHLVSRSFGGTQTMITKTTYLEGTIAGTLVGALAAAIYVQWWAALIAAFVAMVLEAGELRIGEHHVDDNVVIPVAVAVTLWLISLAFPI